MRGSTATHRPACPCPPCMAKRGERPPQVHVAFKASGELRRHLEAERRGNESLGAVAKRLLTP